ncbi:hypothetical protein BpHYR1_041579 [Brachionus plicatilis]|uniref:Uncharacterized protein n=1 Tax=Brachionus plicatilis TaxID=10195 RepID=A0A3M7SR88_BRAPC|nr:hypothetical protein BpHYR1_041579 [Brachionus plicatilis]
MTVNNTEDEIKEAIPKKRIEENITNSVRTEQIVGSTFSNSISLKKETQDVRVKLIQRIKPQLI